MKNDVCVQRQVLANNEQLGADDARRLAHEASRVVVAKGRKNVTFNMKKEPPDEQTLLKHMLGPTGNLRAPIIKTGTTVIVGFNQEVYEQEI